VELDKLVQADQHRVGEDDRFRRSGVDPDAKPPRPLRGGHRTTLLPL